MTKDDKPTSQPLPSPRMEKKRAEALRNNLLKRKQQTRARDTDARTHDNEEKK
jgi:hypothetical protein